MDFFDYLATFFKINFEDDLVSCKIAILASKQKIEGNIPQNSNSNLGEGWMDVERGRCLML